MAKFEIVKGFENAEITFMRRPTPLSLRVATQKELEYIFQLGLPYVTKVETKEKETK